MKRSKEYRKMIKNYKKLIRKDAKEASTRPWDYAFGLDMFVDYLNFMRDYYELDENVWGIDESGDLSRLQALNMILAEYDAWKTCEDKYFSVERSKDDGSYKLLIKDIVYADHKINLEAFQKEYTYHRCKFFELLGTYIEKLWD